MSSSKRIDLYRDFAAGVHLSEAQNSLYTCVQYTYSHREEGRGGEMNQREG
jgi:hypothetical protein